MFTIRGLVTIMILLGFSNELFSQKVGLVLSGGGAKGLAHIGVLKALEENEIPVDYIVGTSMGGLVGGFYAAGYSPEEMEAIATSDDFQDWVNGRFDSDFKYFFLKKPDDPSWITAKLLLDTAFHVRLRTNIANDIPLNFALLEMLAQPSANAGFDFDSLFVPFRCMVADIFSQEAIMLKQGSLGNALRGTMSVPFYYRPVKVDNKYVFDGGLYDNFPVNVLKNEFDPDVLLGSNTSAKVYNEYPFDKDRELISKLTMFLFLSKTDSTQLGENGVFINPVLSDYSATDFDPIAEYIEAGYEAALAQIDRIREQVGHRRVSKGEVRRKRAEFNNRQPPVKFNDIVIKGANSRQRKYIERVFRQEKKELSLEDIRKGYYRLVADDNFETVYPNIAYNAGDSTYTFELEVTPDDHFRAGLGGNISTRPVSTAFLGLEYNFLERFSYTGVANFYAGRFYEAAQLKGRVDIPMQIPLFLELDFTYNHWNYFRGSEIFIEDLSPTYIDQSDRNIGFSVGVPGRRNGRYELSASRIRLNNKYYLGADDPGQPLDHSVFDGYKMKFEFDRNTLNRKQYPSEGGRLKLGLYRFDGNERFFAGGESESGPVSDDRHGWWMAKFSNEKYFRWSYFGKMGYNIEAVWTNQPYFHDQKATLLMAPVYDPFPDTRSLFLERLRAQQYAGAGLKNIITFVNNVDLRLEGHLFKPYQRLVDQDIYGERDFDIKDLSFLGTAALIYHSPLGPVSVNASYYDNPDKQVGIMFNLGYMIYNKRANE